MLVINGKVFVHIPKCGGTAIRSVLKGKEAGRQLPMGEKAPIKSPWHRVGPAGVNIPTCMVVREPVEWLLSYWADQAPIRNRKRRFLQQYWDQDPERFLTTVCHETPGYVTELFDTYEKSFSRRRVFRLEDGLDHVTRFLMETEVPVPHINKSEKPVIGSTVRRLVEETERGAYSRYGYGRT